MSIEKDTKFNTDLSVASVTSPGGDEAFRLLFENNLDAVVIADDEGNFVDVNAPACALFGYAREQMLGMRVGDLVTPEEPGAAERYERYLLTGRESGEFTFLRPDNEIRTATYSACRMACGRHLSILRDITEQRQGESALDTLDALMDNIPTGITIADAPDGAIRHVSKHGEQLSGRDRLEFEGIPVEEYAAKWGTLRIDGTPATPEELPLTRAVKRGEEVFDEEWVIVRPGGEKITVLCNARPIRNRNGEVTGGVAAWQDITVRKETEKALLQANMRLTDVLENIADAFISIDHDWRCTYVNAAAEHILGRQREELLGQDIRQASTDPSTRRMLDQYAAAIAAHTPVDMQDYYAPLDIWLEIRAFPTAEGLSIFFRDITARRRMEEERAGLFVEITSHRKRLDDLVSSIPGVVWEAWGQPDTASQRINYVSEYVEKMLGYTVEEWLSTPNFWLTIVHPDDREKAARTSMEAWASASEHTNQFRWIAKDGSVIHVESYSVVLQDADGQPLGMRGVTLDISERHHAEAQVLVLNSRMHRAVYESTHRIKNHLQILTATVDMALLNRDELIPADEFRRLGIQIQTLSVLQDILTLEWKADATGSVETVSSKAMLERVMEVLQQNTAGGRIVFEIADTPLSVKAATSLALICNEAASNAIKHGKKGVEVLFDVIDETGVLEVCDDGPGFAEGFDPHTAANTGLELVTALAQYDLKGTVEYKNRLQGGGRFILNFPIAIAPDYETDV
ncbi:MAG: PAS domain S-box protein [Chthonomonadales bacterium]